MDAVAHNYRALAERELDDRLERGYPPFGHLVRVVVSGASGAAVSRRCGKVAERLRALPEAARVQILGPAPCQLARRQGKSRWQLLIKTPDRAHQRAVTRALRPLAGSSGKTQVALDVDPISMM